MKRREIVKRIGKAARRQRVAWEIDREGGEHTVYRLGSTLIPIPRHAEIGEGLSKAILKQCEPELGKGWWRR